MPACPWRACVAPACGYLPRPPGPWRCMCSRGRPLSAETVTPAQRGHPVIECLRLGLPIRGTAVLSPGSVAGNPSSHPGAQIQTCQGLMPPVRRGGSCGEAGCGWAVGAGSQGRSCRGVPSAQRCEGSFISSPRSPRLSWLGGRSPRHMGLPAQTLGLGWALLTSAL